METEEQRRKKITRMAVDYIFDAIDDSEGVFNIDFEYDENTSVNVSGYYEYNGYSEDDYYGGTGAYVTTRCKLFVDDCIVVTYDDDGEIIDDDFFIHASDIEELFGKMNR